MGVGEAAQSARCRQKAAGDWGGLMGRLTGEAVGLGAELWGVEVGADHVVAASDAAVQGWDVVTGGGLA